MRFTISREKLQEGLAGGRGEHSGQDHAARAREHPRRDHGQGHSALRHRSRHRGEHRSRGRCRVDGRDHHPGEEAERDRARAAAVTGEDRRRWRAARHARLRTVALQDPRSCRATSFPSFPVVRFDESWRIRSGDLQKLISHTSFAVSHGGEPADPQRRALGAQAGDDAHGGHERSPPGEDGDADQVERRARGGSHRAAKGARADSSAVSGRRRARDRAGREPPRLPLAVHRGLHAAHRGTVPELRSGHSARTTTASRSPTSRR